MVSRTVQTSGKPRHRSRSLKRRQVRIPGGKTVTQYNYKKPSKHICAICKALLHGTPRGRPIEIKKLDKTSKRPSRPFGGQLCAACTRKIMLLRAQIIDKQIKLDDVQLSLKPYVGVMKK
jgi:large subunit ribosomal protein L34e